MRPADDRVLFAIRPKHAIVAVVAVVGIALVVIGSISRHDSSASTASAAHSPNYNPNRICDFAPGSDKDYSGFSGEKFEVPLREGCWSGWVTLPSAWHTWYAQLNNPDDWVSGWYSQGTPVGPLRWDQPIVFYRHPPTSTLRFQGHGTLILYTNEHRKARAEATHPPGSSDADTGGTPPHEESSPPGTTKIINDFLFTLGTCTLDTDQVLCELKVTNRVREDRQYRIFGDHSPLIDSAGYEHYPAKITLGSVGCEGRRRQRDGGLSQEPIKPYAGYCTIQNDIPPDVSMAITIAFEQVPKASTKVETLDIGSPNAPVRFYGIPLRHAEPGEVEK